jgi:hypothetical protein
MEVERFVRGIQHIIQGRISSLLPLRSAVMILRIRIANEKVLTYQQLIFVRELNVVEDRFSKTLDDANYVTSAKHLNIHVYVCFHKSETEAEPEVCIVEKVKKEKKMEMKVMWNAWKGIEE